MGGGEWTLSQSQDAFPAPARSPAPSSAPRFVLFCFLKPAMALERKYTGRIEELFRIWQDLLID